MAEERVRVELGERSYDILIGERLRHQVGQRLQEVVEPSWVAVITDETVKGLYGADVTDSMQQAGLDTTTVAVSPGEEAKSLPQAGELYSALLGAGLDRRSVVVALGGGVVGDLAGFVAATYMRGVPYVQVPTTLLAAVDSSVGGKVAVDLPQGKNLVGAFHQPCLVVIDPETLRSLPARELRAGLAEVVKYGVILDTEFFAHLEDHAEELLALEPAVTAAVIRRCCELKAQVVQEDEREVGLRAILNYGHTFAHALEVLTGYQRFRHGEAVAIGMVCASLLAEELGMVPAEVTDRQVALLRRLGLEVAMPTELGVDELIACFARDKKTLAGQLRLVLPVRIGAVEIVADPDRRLIAQAIERARCVGERTVRPHRPQPDGLGRQRPLSPAAGPRRLGAGHLRAARG